MWKSGTQGENTEKHCSFCHKNQDQVNQLTAGPGEIYICSECVDLYREHIEQEAGKLTAMDKLIQVCSTCGTRPPASHRYCYNCGSQLTREI